MAVALEIPRRAVRPGSAVAAPGPDRGVDEARPSLHALIATRDFRLFWSGQAVSVLGDQFYLVALPWLVLLLTGDPLAVGAVLALAGLPRAAFILVGGALTDRFSARTVMLSSNLVRGLLVGTLAVLVVTDALQPWALYVFALAFGLADAFFYPAQTAMVPQLVTGGALQLANALVQGTAQLAVFVGPVAAGALIAAVGGAHGTEGAQAVSGGSLLGIGVALAVDALSFVVSAATLRAVGGAGAPPVGRLDGGRAIARSIRAGLVAVWADPPVRNTLAVVAGINLVLTGPFSVGIPVLAEQRLSGGALAFGTIISAHGAGCLLGLASGGLLHRPTPAQMWRRFVGVGVVLSAGLIVLALCGSTALAAAAVVPMGAGTGYVVIVYMTWLQARTRPEVLGRVMSLLMFAVLGLGPVSTAAAGLLSAMGLGWLFAGAGVAMAGLASVSVVSPAIRYMGEGRPAAAGGGCVDATAGRCRPAVAS